ncbi:MAG: hypothetical protein U9P12_02275 [Verrucomicrobiota bacterium]|nr:hypothetical protein [Verrucomicrobiota bacterium]
MKRFGLLWSAGLACVLCNVALAQQFRISEYVDGNITIEYPPSFDGAYLFVESSSNLTSNVVWEAVDYTQVELVEGDAVFLSGTDIGCHFGKENIQSEREYSNKV